MQEKLRKEREARALSEEMSEQTAEPIVDETKEAVVDGGENLAIQLAGKQGEIDDLQTRLLRLQADFDNFRRRSRTEMEDLSQCVMADVVGKFLPVLDNFYRALSNDKPQDAESLRQGLELICRQFEKSMEDVGAEKIVALGEQFDPKLHDSVMRSENDQLADGQIDTVFEEGYKIKDKVIRPSKVRVVSNS